MSYANSCLNEREWRQALDRSVAEHKARIEESLRSGPPAPLPCPELEGRVTQGLADIAKVDKAYAWWSSHQYQRLGAVQLTDAPLFADAPAQLTRAVKNQATNT